MGKFRIAKNKINLLLSFELVYIPYPHDYHFNKHFLFDDTWLNLINQLNVILLT